MRNLAKSSQKQRRKKVKRSCSNTPFASRKMGMMTPSMYRKMGMVEPVENGVGRPVEAGVAKGRCKIIKRSGKNNFSSLRREKNSEKYGHA